MPPRPLTAGRDPAGRSVVGSASPTYAAKGCFDKISVAKGDVPYLRGVQATQNDAVRRAAAESGATHVDFSRVSEGHDACQAQGVRWIEPVLRGDDPVVVDPTALGERHMARRTMRVLGLG